MKCAINECTNSKLKNPEKYFFFAPSLVERRELWVKATGRSWGPKSKFRICEDHFDMKNDVEFYRINGAPTLKKMVYPSRNLTQSDMMLQGKLDKMSWSCFVPSCENQRLMTDKKVVFFPVPDGLQGKLWKSVVMEDERYLNTSPDDEIQFCCEEHFDIATDFEKCFHCDSSVEYKVKAGILPSLNLNESKPLLSNKTNQKRLTDLHFHPRVILNNDIKYLYASKLPLIIEKLMEDGVAIVNVKDIKTEPVQWEGIKIEPMDTGYECEANSEFVIKREKLDLHNNPLDSEPECEFESETESESSEVKKRKSEYDPDITSDDFSTTDDDSISSADLTKESSEENDEENDEDSYIESAERFECIHCKQLVKNLENHVERNHLNFTKNVNRTICGLCLKTFPRRINLKNHQITVHNGNAFACDICDRMTPKYAEIQRHIIRAHSHERTFLCQHCGIGYKFIRDLQRHIQKLHMGVIRERNAACDLCEKKFFTTKSLKRHIDSVHLNLRPYHCRVDGCSKAFKQKNYLVTHERQVHTKERVYSCIVCEKQFSFKQNLATHIKNIHKT